MIIYGHKPMDLLRNTQNKKQRAYGAKISRPFLS